MILDEINDTVLDASTQANAVDLTTFDGTSVKTTINVPRNDPMLLALWLATYFTTLYRGLYSMHVTRN